MWKTGKRKLIDFDNILHIIKEVSKYKDHKVIVGSDSVKIGKEFIFANAICIINTDQFYDRRYFYNREKTESKSYINLYDRLLKETSDSINIASLIKGLNKRVNIEIHVDVNWNSIHKSSKYKNMLIGYVKGCGFECKIKPDSFVASGIADVHTRKS